MTIDSVYRWAKHSHDINLPRNQISDVILGRVLIDAGHTKLDGKHLAQYPEDFQYLDSLKMLIGRLIGFYESLPSPVPSVYEYEYLFFYPPDDNTCRELLSQYVQIKEQLDLLK